MAIKFGTSDPYSEEMSDLWKRFEEKKARILEVADEEVAKLEEEYDKRADAIVRKHEMLGIMTSVDEKRRDIVSLF